MDKKTEIISFIKSKNIDVSSLKKVEEELSILGSTEGLEGKNNLDVFYEIWKTNLNKTGHRNNINSWTAFYLGMTEIKPQGDFLPERRAFARAGFPDIDTDFDDEGRDSIYEYIINKYGRDNVGNIGTHGLLKFKSCVTRVVKALDIADAFYKGKDAYISDNQLMVTQILEPFPKKGLLKVKDKNGESHLIKSFKDAYEHCDSFRRTIDKHPQIKKHCEKIEGTFANFGCLSADTPILTKQGWVRIDQITSKHKIAYIDKNKNIKYSNSFKKFRTGKKKVYRLRLLSGYFVDITDEHLVFTDNGCIPFKKIRKNPEKFKIYGFKKGIFE